MEAVRGLAENQYGFREGRSIIGVMRKILKAPQKAWRGSSRNKSVCVLVTLDVRNAFNSIKLVDIPDVQVKAFKVPSYIRRMISDYLNYRRLLYGTTEGPCSKISTARVAYRDENFLSLVMFFSIDENISRASSSKVIYSFPLVPVYIYEHSSRYLADSLEVSKCQRSGNNV